MYPLPLPAKISQFDYVDSDPQPCQHICIGDRIIFDLFFDPCMGEGVQVQSIEWGGVLVLVGSCGSSLVTVENPGIAPRILYPPYVRKILLAGSVYARER